MTLAGTAGGVTVGIVQNLPVMDVIAAALLGAGVTLAVVALGPYAFALVVAPGRIYRAQRASLEESSDVDACIAKLRSAGITVHGQSFDGAQLLDIYAEFFAAGTTAEDFWRGTALRLSGGAYVTIDDPAAAKNTLGTLTRLGLLRPDAGSLYLTPFGDAVVERIRATASSASSEDPASPLSGASS